MPNLVKLILAIAGAAILYVLLLIPMGPLPPLGAFFNPASGFWANAEVRSAQGELHLQAPQLSEPVQVYMNERGVPYIFAQNDYDLYFAQGYVTARDRLFQMELQIRAAGGRLAEWLGEEMVGYDLNQRRIGMMYGAERALEELQKNELTRQAVQAYADGINGYIETLRYDTYPLEYKILNVSPEKWEPINTPLLLMYMTQMLAGRNEDVSTSNTMARFGEEFVNRYLSSRPRLMDPIIPDDKEWAFNPDLPQPPDTLFAPPFSQELETWQPDPLNGSNNWVVDGTKTASGVPILSNDMHLNMSMPSIWYEVQLSTPEHTVYGVTLQGTPTVIVGFNDRVAWGSTNTGADVMDWYHINWRDESMQEYLHDGEWKPVTVRTETVHVRGGETITDTLRFTHHGPVYTATSANNAVQQAQEGMALRWIGHDPSNELLTFYKLNRARNYNDFREAFRSYVAPAQNMNFASVDGDIAMQTGGRFPLKWMYQGRTVSDGSDGAYDWADFIPYDENPYALNPDRGFLSAANQYPVGESYPYYLGESFAPFERGRRINDLLREMDSITVEDFRVMLMDDFSYHADRALPVMLQAMEGVDLDETHRGYLEQLRSWNRHNEGDRIEPSIFHTWWVELESSVWNRHYNTDSPLRRMPRDRFVDMMIEEPNAHWFNLPETEQQETVADHIPGAFEAAINRLTRRSGPDSTAWWGYINNTNLRHLGQIPGLGVPNVFTGGGAESINAIRGSHGPSWRMVVELDPDGVRAYGVYPGGQSGNPGAFGYDAFVEPWRTGKLFELHLLPEIPENRGNFPLVIHLGE